MPSMRDGRDGISSDDCEVVSPFPEATLFPARLAQSCCAFMLCPLLGQWSLREGKQIHGPTHLVDIDELQELFGDLGCVLIF